MVAERPGDGGFAEVERRAFGLAAAAKWMGDHPEIAHGNGNGNGNASDLDLEIPNYAEIIQENARAIGAAAHDRDLQRLAREVGSAWASCAGCHASTRWKESLPGGGGGGSD
jgi:hypothetical protein